MKKLYLSLYTLALFCATTLLSCSKDENVEPAIEFSAKIDGQTFTPKVITGRYFISNQTFNIEAHSLDSTYSNQHVIGLDIEYSKFKQTGEYDFEKDGILLVTLYHFGTDGQGSPVNKGKITIKKLSETMVEATFSSLAVDYPDRPVVQLTNGVIRVPLVKTND